jgi:hypothetical protein
MMRRGWLVAVVASFSMVACGEGPGESDGKDLKGAEFSAPRLDAKGDNPLNVVEAGRLISPAQIRIDHDGSRLKAYRVHGFGETRIQVSLRSPDGVVDPYVLVEGPLPQRATRIVGYNDDRSAQSKDSQLEVTLEEPGAYRVLVGSLESFFQEESPAGALELEFVCLQNCQLPHVTLTELVAEMLEVMTLEQVRGIFESQIAAFFGDTPVAEQVRAQFEQTLTGTPNLEGFPVVPLSAATLVQGLFDSNSDPVPAPASKTFNLDELLREECMPARPSLSAVSPQLPGLQRGSLPDYTYEDCSLERAQQFADVLNNVALANGSAVTHKDMRFDTVESIIRGLIGSGHTIIAENNRYFANFLSLYHQGRTVAAPVWLDTGIALPSGGTLRIPAGHSHYTFRVDGPLFRGDIAFYMGIPGGTAFRADASLLRPNSWSGERTRTTISSATEPEKIVDLFVTAGALRKKWFEAGRSLPSEGYGRLGVCNDSTALLELKVEGTVSLFPMAQTPPTSPQDALEELFAQLPSDINGFDEADAIARILATLPFDGSAGLDLERMPFPSLKRALQALGK